MLQPGPHPVGYRVMPLQDPSRPTGPKRPTDGKPAGDRARRLAVHLWYPAGSSDAPAMTLGEYARAGALPHETPAAAAANHRAMVGRIFAPALSDAEWTAYTAGPMLARRDSAPAAGRHPLLVGTFRPVSMTLTSEYLASHGYVVAFVQSPGREEIEADGAVMEALYITQFVRDMEVAVAALREQPFVDPVALGTLGFSGSGLSSLPLAMRNGDVDAVAQLETGYFGPQGSSYRALPAYDTAALRVPFFYAYGVTLRAPELHVAEMQAMRYAPRVVVYAGEPRMDHWDLATEGPATITLIHRRPDARRGVFRAIEAAHRNLLTFFDAYVKRDQAARSKVSQSFQEPGSGAMVEVQVHPPIRPAMSRREFSRLLDEDPLRAGQLAREGLARDPQAVLFEEAYLNTLGYERLNQRQGDKAIEVLRLNADAHPASANAMDSLSEALELIGRHAAALEAAERALSLLPGDQSVPAPQRKALEDALRTRIGRLKKQERPGP